MRSGTRHRRLGQAKRRPNAGSLQVLGLRFARPNLRSYGALHRASLLSPAEADTMSATMTRAFEPHRFRSTVPFYAAYRMPYPEALMEISDSGKGRKL